VQEKKNAIRTKCKDSLTVYLCW